MSFPLAHPPLGLTELEARLRQDLAWLDLPARPWVPPREAGGQPLQDVAIIGAGMAGLAACAALKQLGVRAFCLDRSPEGFEGPWATTARMETLRSPKQLTGPALGLPALTFRAWFEAQFGLTAWEALDKIPRLQWMDYLRWYRRVLALDVRNDHHVTAVLPRADGVVELAVRTPAGAQTVLARHVVLATGRDGLGGPSVPAFAQRLPRARWAHSSDEMDYASLAGQRVAVIGAGASAMDSAATALEAGAASVDLLIRRDDIPRVNKGKGAGNPGLTHGHLTLPEDWKWRFRHYINSQQVPPPRGSTLRVSRHPNARFNLGCPILDVQADGREIRLATPKGVFAVDFVIFSTGFKLDWQARPEFAAIAPHIRLWGDRYRPAPGEEDQELHDSPDLGPVFEFQEKTPGACPGLARVHCFCYPAALSHGSVSGDIPAVSDGARRLAQGIAGQFYAEDVEAHFANMQAYAEPEVFGDEWTVAPPPGARP
ncbi:NAD(P)-binding domain-containing protein [Bordetella pseudohinzii]|uniref:Dihydropyrimidine dehydrogenase subunit A n=1 Tax=Bordetella pseudohinzii TaxID=1331258 RepID=A0A0J6C9P2_9BORD|nr:NAD(P)/FAD-dependent oxidoreductase [Bordetella pseudohinzii]ANY16585.1 FAD-dependent oxidoreductase [Bordetella pseudohinzii]KMM27738.1 FAD-dependent oxidoreductase [Bordetella pseudohinzii]KXA81889.1 FAD-dependent oxidoreductase [Bordetella pseudohinzii]KXA82190.1 FAD-dependent oxidoreductase [Bordetella pseudohinzii]CUI31983.1 dihydropyrimidine dehydrogenase subunit A [Bordetella pseudohinzii]